jgi:class 3 adenylate cyclase
MHRACMVQDYVRVPPGRRIRLSPVPYAPLPNVEQYKAALTLLSGPVETARIRASGWGGSGAAAAAAAPEVAAVVQQDGEHFQALQNLLHPGRVVSAAEQLRRATAAAAAAGGRAVAAVNGTNGSVGSGNGSSSGGSSPSAGVTLDDDQQGPSELPFQLPSVGATGVQLLQALSGAVPRPQPQLGLSQQQQQQAVVSENGSSSSSSSSSGGLPPPAAQPPRLQELGGTPVTAQPAPIVRGSAGNGAGAVGTSANASRSGVRQPRQQSK